MSLCCSDLSDATGHDTHEVNQYAWKIISEMEHYTPAEQKAGHLLLGPQMDIGAEGGPALTKRSSHMGIGLGWHLMCLKLAYCAFRAGVDNKRLAIMGDDTALLGTCEEQAQFMRNQEKLTYSVNRSKSFAGKRYGVFCENFLETRWFKVDGPKEDLDSYVSPKVAANIRRQMKGPEKYLEVAKLMEILPIGQAALRRSLNRDSVTDRPNERATGIDLSEYVKEVKRQKRASGVVSKFARVPKAMIRFADDSARRALKSKLSGPAQVGGCGRGKLAGASWLLM